MLSAVLVIIQPR